MSDTPIRDPIDIQAIVARIDRDLSESAKLRAETHKFVSEQRKMDRDRFLSPWLAVAVIMGGVGGGIGGLVVGLLALGHSVGRVTIG